MLRGDPDNINMVDGYITLDVFPLIGDALAQLQEEGLIPAGIPLPDLSSPDAPGALAQRLGSALGITLPEGFGTIKLMPADQVLAARTAVKAFDIIVVLLIALSIILVALALWLADRRRRMVIFLAIGTIIAFVIGRTLIRGVEGAIVGGIADEDLAGAVRTSLDAVFDDLRGLTLHRSDRHSDRGRRRVPVGPAGVGRDGSPRRRRRGRPGGFRGRRAGRRRAGPG